MSILGQSVSSSRKSWQHWRTYWGHKRRSALRPNDRYLVSRAGDADAQQASCCGSLRLGVRVAKEVALVLPLDEQDAIELLALGLVDGHEHAAAWVALVGLESAYLERAAYEVDGAAVATAEIPRRGKSASDLIGCAEESDELGVRQKI